jgi:hypothetical protein
VPREKIPGGPRRRPGGVVPGLMTQAKRVSKRGYVLTPDARRLVAKFGGWPGATRKQDPGTDVLWRGFHDLWVAVARFEGPHGPYQFSLGDQAQLHARLPRTWITPRSGSQVDPCSHLPYNTAPGMMMQGPVHDVTFSRG